MKVAVIGTGTLGPAIAQVFSQSDMIERVFLCKGRKTSARDGKESIVRAYEKLIAREKLERERAEAYLSKLETGNKELAASADLLVEAVSESLEIKLSVFKELDKICRPDCIFTTNTSSLPIRSIEEGITRPCRLRERQRHRHPEGEPAPYF